MDFVGGRSIISNTIQIGSELGSGEGTKCYNVTVHIKMIKGKIASLFYNQWSNFKKQQARDHCMTIRTRTLKGCGGCWVSVAREAEHASDRDGL